MLCPVPFHSPCPAFEKRLTLEGSDRFAPEYGLKYVKLCLAHLGQLLEF